MNTPTIATDDFKDWFKNILDLNLDMARSVIGSGKQVEPHLLIFERDTRTRKEILADTGTKPRVAYLPVEMNNGVDKDVTSLLQRALASDTHKIAGVVLTTEAWSLKIEKDDKQGLARMRREGIEGRDDKQECVMVSALRGNMQLLAFADVERPEGKPPVVLDPIVLDAAVEGLQGRFMGEKLGDTEAKDLN